MSRPALVLLLGLVFGCREAARDAPSEGTRPPTDTPSERDASASVDAGGWGNPTSTLRRGRLRIAQLNVRRLFDATCESEATGGECNDSAIEGVLSPKDFDARTSQLATALATLDADVITLAEVENQGCLDAIHTKLKRSGRDYPVAHVAETSFAGSIDVAVLARGKLETIATHRDAEPLVKPDGKKTTFTRELPEVHLTFDEGADAKRVIVFAAHFKSKANDDPGRRLAEAEKTHELMLAAGAANPRALVLLGGDLNDVPGSEPIDALENGGELLRVASDLPPASQGTYAFSGTLQALDHIFTNRASAYIARSAKVVRDASQSGFGGSDHAAIYADFSLP